MRIIAVVGAGAATPKEERLAEKVGRGLAEAGAILICGGRGGVMAAACRGAREAHGITVGILPGTDAREANPWVSIPLATGLGEARNAVIASAAQAVIAIGGEWGTLSEIALARKMGRPVIGLETWQLQRGGQPVQGICYTDSPEEAVRWAITLQQTVGEGQSCGS
jgi:uncharacterized protein (TIGR00725 family)